MKRLTGAVSLGLFFCATVMLHGAVTPPKKSWCFVFGPAGSSGRPGFVSVNPSDRWSETGDYGWLNEGVAGTLRPAPDEWHKTAVENTFHEGKGVNTFRVRAGRGAYRVLLVAGDLMVPPPAFALSVNGQRILSRNDTDGLSWRTGLWTRDVKTTNGYLDFEFAGLPNYIVNTLVIAPVDEWAALASVTEALAKERVLGPAEQLKVWHESKRTEKNPAPVPTAGQKKQGLIVFARESFVPVFPDTIPAAEEIASPIRGFAAQGETGSLTFGVYPVASRVTIASAAAGELKSSGGHGISRENLSLKEVSYRYRRSQWSGVAEYELGPDVLADISGPVALDETRLFWLRVRVPASAAAGVYRGAVSLRTDRGTVSVPVSLSVLPFALPERPARIFGMYYLSPEAYVNTPE